MVDAINETTHAIIGAAIEVHRILGPGLLEMAYEECLCRELTLREVPFGRQVPLSVEYKGARVECAYRVDLVVVEIKAIENILPVHEAQLLTYLRIGGWRAGLLLNFNVPVMRDGICRRIFNLIE